MPRKPETDAIELLKRRIRRREMGKARMQRYRGRKALHAQALRSQGLTMTECGKKDTVSCC